MPGLLKFMTCGSVDDGKSTLIGRLLYDAKLLYTDQVQKLELESKVGSRAGAIDYSLLLDGLSAEREQGITIDVAYRYFNTENRSFIVADTPGHEQYTRNMAVGASFADLAILLVDATQGILTQTKRHLRISSLMGIRHFILAINKMDLVEYKESVYAQIKESFENIIESFNYEWLHVIPVSATEGDNIKLISTKMPWYQGLTLFNLLETIDVTKHDRITDFIMPVQRVARPDHTFRGYQGNVIAGKISLGQEIIALPSREKAKVKALLNTNQSVKTIEKEQAVTIQLDREIDLSRGDVITTKDDHHITHALQAQILWMDDNPLIQGKSYLLKLATQTVLATVLKIKYQVGVNTGDHIPTNTLEKNEMAVCEISTATPLIFESFDTLQALGSFILIDRVSHMTSAGGIIDYPLRRSQNIFTQASTIDRHIRADQKNQIPFTIWFTGLSGSGKSTLANALEKRLVSDGYHTMLLDGDNVRQGLNKNLGFNPEDRIENIRRISEVAKLMNDAGLITITSFIAPYESDRQTAREIIGTDAFIEVHVSTPLETCEKRDVKGLYKKAREGKIPNFTGISSPYETPLNPDIVIDTTNQSIDASLEMIYQKLKENLIHGSS